jgi:hypothetical protein
MKIAVAALLAVAMLPTPSHAAPAAPRAGRTPARTARPAKEVAPLQLQVARAVFPREHWQKLVRDASDDLTQRITASAQGQYEIAPEFGDRLREEYEKLASYDEIIGYQAEILEKEYTRAELKQLLVFFRSPLGRRASVLLQDLMQVSHLQMRVKVRDGLQAALGRLVDLVHPLEGDGAAPETDGEARENDAGDAPDLSAAEAESKVL